MNAKITKNILFYAYYSYTDAKSVATDGKESLIPRISQNKIWAGLTAQNLLGYVTLSPRLRWVGEMFNNNKRVFPDGKQPGYYTIDLSLSVNNLSKYFRIFANFNNILNQEIVHGGLYMQDDAGVYTATIPQDGFTFNAGVEFFFNK